MTSVDTAAPATGSKLRFSALSFATGLHLAILQSAYFLLLEAYLSSRAFAYFVTLLFWLVGLLIGLLWGGAGRRCAWLLAAGLVAYYATWALARWIPFHPALYSVAGLCSVVSGLLPGVFFRFVALRCSPVRVPLFHENNGFILGTVIALRGAIQAEGRLLAWGPLITAAVAALVLAVAERRSRAA